ncbi:MAG TPA: hypothetical protein VIX42_03125 [Edaphobacter sp.]
MRATALAYWLQASLLLSAASGGAVKTAQYPYPWGAVSVSFDPATTTQAELDSWMPLSPDLSPFNDLLVPIDIRRCLTRDKEYVSCGDRKLHLSNVDVNIRKMRAIRDGLKTQPVPADLKPIVAYLIEMQNFSLWYSERIQEYLRTNDVTSLTTPYGSIDPKRSCTEVLQKMAQAKDKGSNTDRTMVDWHNCLLGLERAKIGPYPKAKWEAFLRARGITEVVKEEVPDD